MSESVSNESKGIPALRKASFPPSSLSNMANTPTTLQSVVEDIIFTALIAEPPVVVTSSNITIFPPLLNEEPSIPGGFEVFLPPLPLFHYEW